MAYPFRYSSMYVIYIYIYIYIYLEYNYADKGGDYDV